jgi:uncharacterized protein YerC
MQLSKKKLNKNLENQLKKMWYGLLAEMNSPKEIEELLADLLTEAEKVAIYKRLGIGLYLDKGRSYENIKNHIKVSSATIASVAENVGKPGFQEAIRRIKADEWAEEWSNKISQKIKKFLPV